MGSRNGVYAGDRETYQDDDSRVYRHELADGDYLLLGETTLVFKRI
jgi:pSer/pThr/pTyr-binding forkhead associated (FHA) protein